VFPIQDNIPRRNIPIVTVLLIIINCFIFTIELTLPEHILERVIHCLGIVPARFTDGNWGSNLYVTGCSFWSLITSMFLHGGWFHIISNMWIFWIFGDNVECRMGHTRFFVFYILCGMLASVVHIITNPSSPVPTIGASGAIAGILGAYFLLFPSAQVVVFFPLFLFWPIFYIMPAFVYLGIWFILQFLNGTLSLVSPSAAGSVAWWAHIGGFIGGVILHRLFIKAARSKRHRYPDELDMRWVWSRY